MAPPRPPRLIHVCRIGLTRIDGAHAPALDPEFGNPSAKPVYLPEITITAQITIGEYQSLKQAQLGTIPQASGHFSVEVGMWSRETSGAPLPRIGDRVTRLYVDKPGLVQVVNWTVTKAQPSAHYLGQPWIWQAFWERVEGMSELAV